MQHNVAILGLILSSGLFDEAWYLEQNPDVAKAQIKPLLHFLQYGGAEGRSPGPNFSSAWYLESYQDVRKIGINPLVHYLRYGRHEGRSPNPKGGEATLTSPKIVVADVPNVAKRVRAVGSIERSVRLRGGFSLDPLMRRGSGDQRYALLSYTTRNLGDDIQSLAALQFLPHVDALVDRDQIGEFQGSAEHRILMNGWFMGRRSWPPPESLRPFYVSFHLGDFAYADHENPSSWLLSEVSLDHLRKFQPVGCRDMRTVQLLEANGVAGYFSGCLTLTLPPAATTHSREEILLVDTAIHPNELYRSVPPKLSSKVSVITHTPDRLLFS